MRISGGNTGGTRHLALFVCTFLALFCLSTGSYVPVINAASQDSEQSESNQQDTAKTNESGNKQTTTASTPSYEVNDQRRSPFLIPGEPKKKIVVTEENVRKTFSVEAVIGSTPEAGNAIINGGIYHVGDELTITVNNDKYSLELIKLLTQPPGVVLKKGEREFKLLVEGLQ